MERIFYLGQVVQGINALMCVAFGVGLALVVITGAIGLNLYYEDDDEVAAKRLWSWMRRFIVISFIGCLGMIFIPSKQTFMFMVGGKVVDNAIQDKPEIKELPSNTLDLLNEYIKAETEKVREKKTKNQ